MRLIEDPKELAEIKRHVPQSLQGLEYSWADVSELPYAKRCDLFYFDVIDERMLSAMPAVLQKLEEPFCYVWSHELLCGTTAKLLSMGPALELLSTDNEQEVLRELGNPRSALRDVYFLGRLVGIVPWSAEWMILAELDERALFLSNNEWKYSVFQSLWWPQVLKAKPVVNSPDWDKGNSEA